MEQRRRNLLTAGHHDATGSIQHVMGSYIKHPAYNDGEHKYGNVRVKPKTSGPWQSTTHIELPLTSDTWDITEFENTYIHFVLQVKFYATGIPTISGTDDFSEMLKNHQYVFFGLKSSNHIIGDYRFMFNDHTVSSSSQPNALYESFLYSNFKSKGEIANKRWVYSPYGEVEKLDNSICGMYIPIGELTGNSSNEYKVMFDVIVPINEILAMEAFDEYPNKIFGELKLFFTTTYNGFVFTEVNPIESIKKGIVRGDIDATNADLHLTDVLAVDAKTFPYTHAFQQQGIANKMSFITGYDSDNATLTFSDLADVKLTCYDLQTLDIWCDVRGYKASSGAMQNMYNSFCRNPFVVCAQRVERTGFNSKPTVSGGIHTDITLRFNRVTDINILMPTHSLQRTVYTNPALRGFQVIIGNDHYPDQQVTTLSPEFFENQIQSTDFDSFFEATDSYEHSLTDARVDENGEKNPITDDTSFVPIFSLERANAGELVFDGLDQLSVKVELHGTPLYSTSIYPRSDDTDIEPPALCTTTDTYWIFRIINGVPNCQYVVQNDFDTAYANPDIEATKA